MFTQSPFYRFLVLLTLICVSLAACTSAPALTPTATLPIDTPIPSATATEAPTPKPTNTPESTAISTEVDPTAPDGTRCDDALGICIEKDGIKYRQIELTNPVTGEKTNIWAFSVTEGEKMIALYDWDEDSNKLGWSDQIRFQFFIDPRVPGAETFPTMSYIQEVWRTHEGEPNFIGVFRPLLNSSRAINTPGVLHRLQDVVYHFTTSAGSFDWAISYGDENDATTIIRRLEDLPLEKGNGVIKILNPYNWDTYFYVKMYTVQNKLITEIASEVPLDKLSNNEKIFMALFGQLSIILSEEQVDYMDISTIQPLVDISLESKAPYFSLIPRK